MSIEDPNIVLVRPLRTFKGQPGEGRESDGMVSPESPAFPVTRQRCADLKANGLVEETDPEAEEAAAVDREKAEQDRLAALEEKARAEAEKLEKEQAEAQRKRKELEESYKAGAEAADAERAARVQAQKDSDEFTTKINEGKAEPIVQTPVAIVEAALKEPPEPIAKAPGAPLEPPAVPEKPAEPAKPAAAITSASVASPKPKTTTAPKPSRRGRPPKRG